MRPSEVTIQLDWVKEIGSRLYDRINQVIFDFHYIAIDQWNGSGGLGRFE